MTTKYNLEVSGTDFDEIKRSLKEYMKVNSGLTDVDFEGSAASTLLDVLAYNTFYNNVYLNSAVNEMFLSTAVQRQNVVSHADMLGYTPRSYSAAKVVGEFVVVPNDTPTNKFIVVPTGTVFTTKIENRTYRFQNRQATILEYNGVDYRGSLELHEGTKYSYRYVVDLTNLSQRFVIPNADIDIDLITVGVIRDSVYTQYTKSESITASTPTTKQYWVSEGDDALYEIEFGDGIFGEGVVDGDIVVIEYFVCNGAIPNGARDFECQTSISGYSNTQFIPNGPAVGGSVSEDIESIRNNATNYFETQNRAVTWKDYESLFMKEFKFLETISVWGGEENSPPRYGRVFISAKPIDGETLTSTEIDSLTAYIKSKNVASITPVFVQPDYIFLKIDSTVKFNYERSPYGISEVQSRVKDSILEFIDTRLEKFTIPFKYSNLLTLIDESAVGISSNTTSVRLLKRFSPSYGERERYVFNFGTNLKYESIKTNGFKSNLSNEIIYLESSLTKDITGSYPITYYYINNGVKYSVNTKVGTVDYENGIIEIDFITISEVAEGDVITVEVSPVETDYTPIRNQVLSSRPEDITVTVVPETSK